MAEALRGVAFAPQIAAAALRHHLDPTLLAAVAAQETGGPGARSGANIVGDGGHGRGLFQIDDRFHAFARSGEAMDPGKNADYAAGMLEAGLRRFGDIRKALSAYNAGDPNARGTLTTWGDGATLGYADSVLRHCAQLGERAADAAATESPYEMHAANALGNFAQHTPPSRPQAQTQPEPSYRGIIDSDEDAER